jgi:hypothetical protein
VSTLASEVLDKLITGGIVTSGQDFRGQLPVSPDTCVVANETRPWKPTRTMQKAPAVYWLGLQIIVRWAVVSGSYDAAHAKIVAIAEDLQGFVGTLGGHRYLDIEMVQSPAYIGRDENKRDMFSVNFRVCRDAA